MMLTLSPFFSLTTTSVESGPATIWDCAAVTCAVAAASTASAFLGDLRANQAMATTIRKAAAPPPMRSRARLLGAAAGAGASGRAGATGGAGPTGGRDGAGGRWATAG